MLKKINRLARATFNDVKWPNTRASAHFALKFASSSQEKRFAVSVSKKVSKSAVSRNTLRRRAYSYIENSLDKIPSGRFHLIAKPGSEALKGEKLAQELSALLVLRH